MPTTYEDALPISLEYFDGDYLAAKVYLDKYALRDKEGNILEPDPSFMHRRMAKELAKIEAEKFKSPLSEKEIFSYLDRFQKFVPQGSIMYGLGNKDQYVTLSNCYVVDSPLDSYGGICHADEQLVQISKRRGGVGMDISYIRPANSPTLNASRTSTGIGPFMERWSNSIREVGQGGRRGALMLSIDVHHPEIATFISIKRDKTKVTGANISVRFSDEFFKALVEGKDYELRWRPSEDDNWLSYGYVSAQEIWDQIIENAHAAAEPGLLFWDNIIRESPADCYAKHGFKTVSTNPCSEIPLCHLDSCRLLAINLFSYVKNPFVEGAYFDFEKFYKDAQIAQRLMDDIVDAEIATIERIIVKIHSDPEPLCIKDKELNMWLRILQICKNGRRTGTGITALGDTLAACGIKYATKEGIDFSERIYKTLKLGCYRSSVDMAKELDAFPIWKHELEKDCPFLLRIKEEDPDLWKDMKKYGRRNIALLTTAPTGSVSMMTQTTSGIEPQIWISFTRRKKINPNDKNARVDYIDDLGDKWEEFEVFAPKVKMWMEVTGEKDVTKSPWDGCLAGDLDWEDRVRLQAAANRHVDHAISSTINLPSDVSVEEVGKIYIEAWKSGCKGMTVYREGCRSGVIVQKETKDDHNPQERPKELPCDVHHIKVRSKDGDVWTSESYFVLVGLNEGRPYEVFAGKNGQIAKEVNTGIIKKVRSHYRADFEDGASFADINHFVRDDEEGLTRLTSLLLRNGVSILDVVKQLERVQGDLLLFSKSVARALKKYIPDGHLEGEPCPECGADLVRESGCATCKACGWSKCQ